MILNFPPFLFPTAVGFDSEEELLEAMTLSSSNNILGGIIFKNDFTDDGQTAPPNMTYSIRLSNSMRNVENENSMSQWQTEDLFPFYQVPGPRNKDDLYGGVPGRGF